MCGIVGLFLKTDRLQGQLGALTAGMLKSMTGRGPDSAGFAIYGDGVSGTKTKLTLRVRGGTSPDEVIARLERSQGTTYDVTRRDTHAILVVPDGAEASVRAWLESNAPEIDVVGAGRRMEIYKEAGLPAAGRRAVRPGRHDRNPCRRPHAHGQTESAVTTSGAHPFSTGADQCLVHNGSLSNHSRLRRMLEHEGLRFATANDSEVAAGYLTWRMREGASLEEALEAALADLDGFFTFVVGTRTGFAVAARPDRVQAGGHGGDRRLRRLRLGISRAGRAARHRGCPRVRAGTGDGLRLGPRRLMPAIDLRQTSRRDLNGALHALRSDTKRDPLGRDPSRRAACHRLRSRCAPSASRSRATSAIIAPA